MKDIKKLSLENLVELRNVVQKEIDKKTPTLEELITLGIVREFYLNKTPKNLEKEYKDKLDKLTKIYKNKL